MAQIDFSKIVNQPTINTDNNTTIDFSALANQPQIDFKKIENKSIEQPKGPGFLETLRFTSLEGLVDLWKYESLPVAAYQALGDKGYRPGSNVEDFLQNMGITNVSKQNQAKEAVSWLAANENKKDTNEYAQYKKIERLYGYTLSEEPFNIGMMKEALEANPGMFAGEMANAVVADPYLVFPLFWEGWIAKGIQATKTAQKVATTLPRTVKGTSRAVASVPMMSAYSSIQQLSEDGSLDPKRLATETALGGSAAFAMGALTATQSSKLGNLFGRNGREIAEEFAKEQKLKADAGDPTAIRYSQDDITNDWKVIIDRHFKEIESRQTGLPIKDTDVIYGGATEANAYIKKMLTNEDGTPNKDWGKKFTYKHAEEPGVYYNKVTDRFKLIEHELESMWTNKFKSKFSKYDDFLDYKKNAARIKNDKRFKSASAAEIEEEALFRTFRQREQFNKYRQRIEDEVGAYSKEAYNELVQKANTRFYHISNIVQKSETPAMVGALLGAGGYLASGEDEQFWKMAAVGAGTITLGKTMGSYMTRLNHLKLGKRVIEGGDTKVAKTLSEIKKELPEGKTLDDISIKGEPEFYLDPKIRQRDIISLGKAEQISQGKSLAISRYLLEDYRIFTQSQNKDINIVANKIAYELGTPEREIEVTKWLQAKDDAGRARINLSKKEIKIAKEIREDIYNKSYGAHQDSELRFKFYEDYVTGFWKWNEFADDVSFAEKVRDIATKGNAAGMRGKNLSQLEKEFPSYEAGIAAGLKPQTMEISKIVSKYLNAQTRALAQRRLTSMLEDSPIPGRGDGKGGIAKMMYKTDEFPNNADMIKDYVKMYHPAFLNKGINPAELNVQQKNTLAPYVLKEAEPLLRMVYDATDEGSVMKAISNVNFFMKRMSVGYSFFHAFTLFENMMFTGVGFREAGKTGSRAMLSNKWTDKKVPIISWHKTTASKILERSGHHDDMKQAIRAGVEFSHPEDIGYNRFYNIIGQAQDYLDNSNIWGSYLAKQGIKYGIELPFKTIDNITWDRVYNAGKLYAFQTAVIKLLKDPKYKNVPLTKIHQVAATYTNDAYGGLNWTKLYMDTSDPVLKYIKSKAYKPSGRRLLQIAMFAPDWTTANFRILSRAFPGLNKDPMSRKLYTAYAVRAALIIGTAGMALQQMFTGTSLLSNDDPTRVDLGNGMQLVLSKQFFEPLHWAVHPFKTAVSKQGMLIKTSEQLFFNKKFLTSPWPSPISKRDASLLRKAYDYGGTAGMAFVPFSFRGLIEDALDEGLDWQSAVSWVSGSLGHPIYNIPRNLKMKGIPYIQQYLNIK